MTEEEAKTKWRPMVQVTSAQNMNDIEYGDNRGNGDESHKCITSNCMMWKQTEAYWGKDGARVPMDELRKYKTPEDGGFETIAEGRCGLAK